MIKFFEKIGIIGTFLFTVLVTIVPPLIVGFLVDGVNETVQNVAQVLFYVMLSLLTLGWILAIIGTSKYPKSNNEPIRNAIRKLFFILGWRND
jgi:ABC-type transport system involved in multi-copper enzyme maturation permease subunit